MNYYPTWNKNQNRKKSKKSLKQALPDENDQGGDKRNDRSKHPRAKETSGYLVHRFTRHVGQLGHPATQYDEPTTRHEQHLTSIRPSCGVGP